MNYIKINYLVFFYLTIFLLTSCKNERKQVRPFPIEFNMEKNGKYDGLFFYLLNDSILRICFYQDGFSNGGVQDINIKNGFLKSSSKNKMGQLDGVYYDFYPSGVVKEFNEYRNNKKVNTGVEYFDKSLKVHKVKEYNDDGYIIYRLEKDSFGNIIKEENYQ